jgi:hypothetical protein
MTDPTPEISQEAARAMLAALRAAVVDIECGALEPSDFPWLRSARAAIALAEGRAP